MHIDLKGAVELQNSCVPYLNKYVRPVNGIRSICMCVFLCVCVCQSMCFQMWYSPDQIWNSVLLRILAIFGKDLLLLEHENEVDIFFGLKI